MSAREKGVGGEFRTPGSILFKENSPNSPPPPPGDAKRNTQRNDRGKPETMLFV